MHCPQLMMSPCDPGANISFLQQLEASSWVHSYLPRICKVLSSGPSYRIFCRSAEVLGLRGQYQDVSSKAGNDTSLPREAFYWLLNIRLGYLVYVPGRTPVLEPYVPCRFARQFGYDQLYVGNPNSDLRCRGTLFDAARAWSYNIAGCTGVRFRISPWKEEPKMTLSYCTWYVEARETPGFDPEESFMADIRAHYERHS